MIKKLFWEIVGLENTYTDIDFMKIVDKKTKQEYFTGKAYLFDSKNPPKNVIHSADPNYDIYLGGRSKGVVEKKKVGFLKWETRTVYQYKHKGKIDVSLGAYFVPGLKLYTLGAYDYIRNKKTNKEYQVGVFQEFPKDMVVVPLVEDYKEEYEYIFKGLVGVGKNDGALSQEEMLENIMITQWFKK